MNEDRTCLSWWFPRIEGLGIQAPRTAIVRTGCELIRMCDGETPEGFEAFEQQLDEAIATVGGRPCFLRTGMTSGKHSWRDTCYIRPHSKLADHVYRLVEFSEICSFVGLPYDVWAARALIPTTPICHVYDGMPLVREFRFFARYGVVEHVQPYWPPKPVEDGQPSIEDWRERLVEMNTLQPAERRILGEMAEAASVACDGFWSVDFLQSSDGSWWLTDMAEGEKSFRWDPEASSP